MARKLDRGSRLVLASHNPGKLAELGDLLRPHGITAISAGSLGLPEPEEDAPDFVGNARIKALGGDGGQRLAVVGGRFRLLRRRTEWRAGRAFGALGRTGKGFCPRDEAGETASGRCA